MPKPYNPAVLFGYRPISAVFVLSLLALSLLAQDAIRVNVRLVTVTATVTDYNDSYIDNLSADQFILEEDGVPQKIAHFTQDRDVPVSIGILLDTSGSMEPRLKVATDAVERFIRNVHKDDDIFLMTFAAGPTLRQDFTSDRSKVSRALRAIDPTKGEFNIFDVVSSIYDSLRGGLDKIHAGKHDKRAILLITDGRDTWSSTRVEDVTKIIRQSEVLVYSLGIAAPPTPPNPYSEPQQPLLNPASTVNMDVLQEFASSSGGRATLLTEPPVKGKSPELDRVLSEISRELRSQYTLAYYPADPDDNQFHAIRVRTRSNDIVRSRNGYLSNLK
jgi:Ca-activated chloride channel homolog